jgi:hypothetical protein
MRRSEENLPSPVSAGAPRSYRRMYGSGLMPTGPPHSQMERSSMVGFSRADMTDRKLDQSRLPSSQDEEGVEVVLERSGTKVVDSPPRRYQDQNVFRPPTHPASRPHAMRPPRNNYGAYPPHAHSRGEYHSQFPPSNQVPYDQSGSFDEGFPAPSQNYSPHPHYPTPRVYEIDDVNVISPNHKPDPYRPPVSNTPRSRQLTPPSHYYQYPPASPVSRQARNHGNSPPPSTHPYERRGVSQKGPYSDAQRETNSYHPDDGTFNSYSVSGDLRPPVVAESSFDSEHYPSPHYSSHPTTPNIPPPEAQPHYYGDDTWGSFDGGQPPFDEYRYYGYHPDSPYSHFPPAPVPPGYYSDQGYPHHSYSSPYDDHGHNGYREYHEDDPQIVTPNDKKHSEDSRGTKAANGSILPSAASEIDFDVTSPPMEPIIPPSEHPICDSPAGINPHDVLCGRGGGTNSQIGNRRFRQLVQDFQPTYLLARRKEKPLLARTIVLIIRNRGGRFLKKDEETGELYEVGDVKAEAKTSQALREGLDVRATKSATSSLLDKKKKKKGGKDDKDADGKESSTPNPNAEEEDNKEESLVASPEPPPSRDKTPPPQKEDDQGVTTPPPSPPVLPRLQQHSDIAFKAGFVHPHSPEALQFRKRRRMRSGVCIPTEDKLFPDFCPPRAHLHRSGSPLAHELEMNMASTPPHRNNTCNQESGRRYSGRERSGCSPEYPEAGCGGIAFSIMTGAATGSFCLGPSNWRRK